MYYEDKQYVGTKNWTCDGCLCLFTFSEIFLQFTEHTIVFDIQNIQGYFRFAHDILIIYDSKQWILRMFCITSVVCTPQKYSQY